MDGLKKIALLCLILTTYSLLSSCMSATSATMTGAEAVYNRNALKKTLNDHYITMKATRAIYIDTDKYKDTHVSVSTFNNVVLLAGEVNTPNQKTAIENIVKKIKGIDELHNLITTSHSSSALTRVSDSWITAKIRAKLIAMNDIDPSKIKVVTENGTVFLMGIIPHAEADIIIDIARTTDGVQSVVKIFSYLQVTKV